MGHPPGRIGVTNFTTITGISRSSFYAQFRWDDRWIHRLDIRISPNGHLSMDLTAVEALAKERMGTPATGASPTAARFRAGDSN